MRGMSCTGGLQGLGNTGQAPRAVTSSSVQPKAVGASPATPVLGELSELRVMKPQPPPQLSLVVNAEQAQSPVWGS